MATLTLESSITCLGCKAMQQYPSGFRTGLCFMCFPRSIDNRDAEINLNDVAAHAAKIAQKYKGVGQ